MFDKDFLKAKIDGLREDIGRNITVRVPTNLPCTICLPSGYYNANTNNSYYVKCPVCQGNYWLHTTSDIDVLARIHWTDNEAATMTPGGKYYVGDARAHVDPSYHSLFQDAQNGGSVVVDGQEMTIVKINPVGVPEVNRLQIILLGKGNRPQG